VSERKKEKTHKKKKMNIHEKYEVEVQNIFDSPMRSSVMIPNTKEFKYELVNPIEQERKVNL
jgi:hypothetical protein